MSTAADFELPFKAPYDWPRLTRFLAGRATPGVEAVEDGVYHRAIEWGGASGTLSVRRHPRKARLVVAVEGEASRHVDTLAPHVGTMFDVDAEPAAIAAHLGGDPWLAPLVGAAPGLRVPGAWSAFELVVRAIVGQQVSVKAATTLIGRLVVRAGARIDDHPHAGTAWRFPTPAALAEADLAQIGMPGKRVAALQAVARAVASGEVPIERAVAANGVNGGVSGEINGGLNGVNPADGKGDKRRPARPSADLATMREALLALPGIGPWTVEYIAMRAWRDPDAWPATDLVLAQSIAARDAACARPAAQRARTDAWRPWRAYAAMHLWNEIADRASGARGG
ncbi:3-methyladenine DNA glycosylase 2 [Trinickia symbiotica]|uniref:DNA-3-methyladenine glycosylase II n=1 Tax=Trinickia symbiotica TaxID=863227 RepID=A0A2T3XYG7_9BURK|nr:DNA-3-methyladenine glycosylase [Trinickia symbiotica]PTB21558.1 3-methyladenine DNA glycosylase 2 [Trinickia symbiotica]